MNLKQILSTIGILIAFVLVFNLVLYGVHEAKRFFNSSIEVVDPKPPAIDPIDVKVRSVSLLETSYIAPNNPFNEIDYSLAPKVAYNGNFEEIRLLIEGRIIGKGERLLMLNVGEKTGIVNAYRKSENSLDLTQTRDSNGVYSEDNPMVVSLDLLNTKLSSSSSDFSNCGSQCRYNLLSSTNLSKVTTILAIPMLLNGSYGGAEINKLEIAYKCKDGDVTCRIEKCNSNDSSYSCIERNFGKEEADRWYEWFKFLSSKK